MEEIPDDGAEAVRRRRSTTGSRYVLSLSNVNIFQVCLTSKKRLYVNMFDIDERTDENRPHLD